jgi:hypothetical protein
VRLFGGKSLADVLLCRVRKMAGNLIQVAIYLLTPNEGNQPR